MVRKSRSRRKVNNPEPSTEQAHFVLVAAVEVLRRRHYDESLLRILDQKLPPDLLSRCVEAFLSGTGRATESSTSVCTSLSDFMVEFVDGDQIKRFERGIQRFVEPLLASWVVGEGCQFPQRVVKLGEILKLPSDEQWLLWTVHLIQDDPDIMRILRHFEGDFNEQISILSRLPREQVSACMQEGSSLRETGVFDSSPFLDNQLARWAADFLRTGDHDRLLEKIAKQDSGEVYPVDSFPIRADEKECLELLLKSGRAVNILFWGQPGSGKTSLARSVVRATGKVPYGLHLPVDASNATTERMSALKMAPFRLSPQTDVLIVDEAEPLLDVDSGRRSQGKAWINRWLDSSVLQVIWIVNNLEDLHEAVRRRMDFNLGFEGMSERQRLGAWKALTADLVSSGRLEVPVIERLAREYSVNTNAIKKSVAVLGTAGAVQESKKNERLLRVLLERHQEILSKGAPGGTVKQLSSVYDLSLVGCDHDLKEVGDTLAEFQRQRERPDFEGRWNALCSGKPGTGKTEWVKSICSDLGMRLTYVSGGDVISPFVGMTERRIAQMFRTAQDEGSVLFLDEADSLLRSREGAKNPWEITQVNEFLTRMDNFSGVFFCATNSLETLDPALMRRFTWKLTFRPPEAEARVRLVSARFPGLVFSEAQQARIHRLEGLTPGDVQIVWDRNRYSPASTALSVVEALASEVSARSGQSSTGRIGFH
ncbi:MAG: AAA family ATPase [Spirochaetales bacterium]